MFLYICLIKNRLQTLKKYIIFNNDFMKWDIFRNTINFQHCLIEVFMYYKFFYLDIFTLSQIFTKEIKKYPYVHFRNHFIKLNVYIKLLNAIVS